MATLSPTVRQRELGKRLGDYALNMASRSGGGGQAPVLRHEDQSARDRDWSARPAGHPRSVHAVRR